MHTSLKKHRSEHAGFTLVETLVAILVLSMSLVAITSLLTRTLQASILSQQYVIASKLAQEGLEMVRVKRNNNLIAQSNPDNVGAHWNSDFPTSIGTPVSYEFEASNANTILTYGNPLSQTPVSSGSTPTLRTFRIYTTGNNAGMYTYYSGTGTNVVPGNFTRLVTLTPLTPYSIAVTSTVSWGGTGPSGQTFSLSTVLFSD